MPEKLYWNEYEEICNIVTSNGICIHSVNPIHIDIHNEVKKSPLYNVAAKVVSIGGVYM